MSQYSIYSKIKKISPFWIKDKKFAYNYYFKKANDFGYDYVLDNNVLYQLSFSTNAGKFTISADAMAMYEPETHKLRYVKAYYAGQGHGYRYHDSPWKKATQANKKSSFFVYESFYDIDELLIKQEEQLKERHIETLCKEGLTFWEGINATKSKPYKMSELDNLLSKEEFKVLQQKYFNKQLDTYIYRDYLEMSKNKPGYKKITTRYRSLHNELVEEAKSKKDKQVKQLSKQLSKLDNAVIRPSDRNDLKLIGNVLNNCIGTMKNHKPQNFYLVINNGKKVGVELKEDKTLLDMRYTNNASVSPLRQKVILELIKATQPSKQRELKEFIGEQYEI